MRTPSSEEPTPFLFTYEKPGSFFFPTWAGADSLEENDHDDRVGDGTLKLANLLTRLGLLERGVIQSMQSENSSRYEGSTHCRYPLGSVTGVVEVEEISFWVGCRGSSKRINISLPFRRQIVVSLQGKRDTRKLTLGKYAPFELCCRINSLRCRSSQIDYKVEELKLVI